MSHQTTDDTIRILMGGSLSKPCTGLHETGGHWGLGTSSVRISKRAPTFTAGFNWQLVPGSHFYMRWFDFADLARRGWAIIFQVHAPDEPGHKPAEYACAWVPPEMKADAERWLDFLNGEIRDRLAVAAARDK